MFTTNFFQDNSQLGFGKRIHHQENLSSVKKAEMRSALSSLIKSKAVRIKNSQITERLIGAISLTIAIALVITAFEWRFEDKGAQITLGQVEAVTEDLIEIPPTEQPPPPPPKIRTATIIEVPDMEEIEDEIEVDLDIEITEDTKIEDVIFEEYAEEEDADEIFIIVEQVPTPVGGMGSFYEYVGKNLRYPNLALRNRVSGKVYVEFVVTKTGNIENVKVVKGIGFGCDEEAAKILKQAPKWNPGKQRGQPVNVRMIMPIHFKLAGT